MGANEQAVATALTRANSRLADGCTPLLKNHWYVAGLAADFTRELRERTFLGQSLVLYRTLAGQPVALLNRCPHRSFPLVHGSLEGDLLRCGYHGLTFRQDGSCGEIPAQATVPPGVCTRSFPVAERGPFVWIWMGDPAQADETAIPDTSWLVDPAWNHVSSYLELDANYVYLHENLLDLSHFTYLHPTTLGTPEYARTPFDVEVDGSRVRIKRFVKECDLPPIYAKTGIKGKISRRTESEFVSPAIHHASALMTDLQASTGQRSDFTILITHFATPQTQDTTHYWFAFARDFALNDPQVDEYMRSSALTAFNEDRHALQEISRIYRSEPKAPETEIHIKSDKAGVAMRRIILNLAADEQG
ncbi:Rieske 2Fe-2S domain-containing protein [Pusillimonas noertemannii]|uniref:Rieske 2Fe-2S domain-containing protein n=1 Tax=Pusillimonas noertemannii TaxID=305977 RepID=UPI0002F1A21D|nr:aromatic ring-hydroxylating dioxygenase subunit alpha [Pusillimonas noertemannii]